MEGQCLENVDYEKDFGVVVLKVVRTTVSGIILKGKSFARADQQNN